MACFLKDYEMRMFFSRKNVTEAENFCRVLREEEKDVLSGAGRDRFSDRPP